MNRRKKLLVDKDDLFEKELKEIEEQNAKFKEQLIEFNKKLLRKLVGVKFYRKISI